jgi:hypothetical protein
MAEVQRIFPAGSGSQQPPTDVTEKPSASAGAETPPPQRKKPGRKPGQQYTRPTAIGNIDAKWTEHEQANLPADGDKSEARRNYYAGALDMLWLLLDHVPHESQRELMSQCQRGLLKR